MLNEGEHANKTGFGSYLLPRSLALHCPRGEVLLLKGLWSLVHA